MGNIQCNCYDKRDQTELYSSIETYFNPPPRDIHAPAKNFFIGLDREFAKKYALKDLLAAYPDRRLSPELVQMIWIHYFTYDESSTVEQSRLEHDTTSTTPRTAKISRHSQSQTSTSQLILKERSDSTCSSPAAEPPMLPPVLTTSHSSTSSITDLDRMIFLVTDVLRHDLAVLKDHFEGLKRQYKRDGLQVNLQDPAVVKIKSDLLKLHHMPVDYIARLILKEMREPEGAAPSAPDAAATSPSNDTASPTPGLDTHDASTNPNQLPSTSPTNGISVHPLTDDDRRASTASFASSAVSPSSRPLSFPIFLARFDACMRACMDRYYRRGFWLLFCLNLMDHHYHHMASRYIPTMQPPPSSSSQQAVYHSRPSSVSHPAAAPQQQPLFLPSSHPQSDAPPSLRRHPSRRMSRRRITQHQEYDPSRHNYPPHPHPHPHTHARPHHIMPEPNTVMPSRSRTVRPSVQVPSQVSSQTQSQVPFISKRSPRHATSSSTSQHPSTTASIHRSHPSISRISVPSVTPTPAPATVTSPNSNPSPSPTPSPIPTPKSHRHDIPRLPLTEVSHDGLAKPKLAVVNKAEKKKATSVQVQVFRPTVMADDTVHSPA